MTFGYPCSVRKIGNSAGQLGLKFAIRVTIWCRPIGDTQGSLANQFPTSFGS